MGKYIHKFSTVSEFETSRKSNYLEPWISYTEASDALNYNKTDYEKAADSYLTITVLSNGYVKYRSNDNGISRTISYKLNNNNWVNITPLKTDDGTNFSVYTGDVVKLKGSNSTYSKDEGDDYNWLEITADCNISGNILSMVGGDNFKSVSIVNADYTFSHFFHYSNIISAENLVLPTELGTHCFYCMFSNCAKLITPPKLLATTLTTGCYLNMFSNCTSLNKLPELSGTTLANGCYMCMFTHCTSLTEIPKNYLPVTTLANQCYYQMFSFCTSLEKVPYDLLPATTLVGSCYREMFYGCSSLEQAPQLPATTLVGSCYSSMFYNCGSLNYIYAMFETEPSSTYTNNWVYGVSNNGLFVKSISGIWDVSGVNGIPSGWQVREIGEQIMIPK